MYYSTPVGLVCKLLSRSVLWLRLMAEYMLPGLDILGNNNWTVEMFWDWFIWIWFLVSFWWSWRHVASKVVLRVYKNICWIMCYFERWLAEFNNDLEYSWGMTGFRYSQFWWSTLAYLATLIHNSHEHCSAITSRITDNSTVCSTAYPG